MNFGQRPCTIVQGVWPDFGATLKISIMIRIQSFKQKASDKIMNSLVDKNPIP